MKYRSEALRRLLTVFHRRRARAVKPDIYPQLVAAMFSPPPMVLVAGTLTIGSLSALAFLRGRDPLQGAFAAAVLTAGLMRIALIFHFRRHIQKFADVAQARRWEFYWSLASLTYAASVGFMSARGLAAVADPRVHLLSAVVTLAAASMFAMSSVRPNIVVGQLALLFLPLLGGLSLRPNPYHWALVICGGLFILIVREMTLTRYKAVVRALKLSTVYSKTAERLARRNLGFQTALSNMAQGLCMVDANLVLTICNRQFIDLYGFSAEVVKPGATLHQLVEHSIACGNHPGRTAEELHDLWLARLAATEPAFFHQTLHDGRTLAVYHRPMADGGYVATVEDVSERLRAAERLDHLARHDVLTDLPNRMYLREQLDQKLRSTTDGQALAVISLDLDGFKAVNDTHGHAAGDDLLRQVADRLRDSIRTDDFIARFGGDEFVLLIPVPDADVALERARAVIVALSARYILKDAVVMIGASAGVALAPIHGCDSDGLLQRADIALYRAKDGGRRTAVLFEPFMAASGASARGGRPAGIRGRG